MRNMLAVTVIIFSTLCARAATITVDDDGPADFASIQAAINDADDGDVIIVSPGRYVEIIAFGYNTVTLTSTDPNDQAVIDATIIDANDTGTVVTFPNGSDSAITGMTITNGNEYPGGGINCNSSSPTISKCNITQSIASMYGGAINCTGGSPTISECSVTGNSARYGGGIYCKDSSPLISKCSIEENSATYGSGIYCENGSPIISECTISGNSIPVVSFGGAILCDSDNAVITKCVITDNTVTGNGGGIYCEFASPIISQCHITDNVAREHSGRYGLGGGIYGSPRISNSIIAGNRADNNGGGIYGYGATITNCTIVKNLTDGSGGGIYHGGNIMNSIIWGNSPNESDGSFIDITYSCIQGISGGEGNIDADPLFVDFDANDFHLQDNSPCIDKVFANPAQLGESDIDGQPRIMGDAADMGADEVFIQTITVTSPIEGETWVPASLRQIEWNSSIYDGPVDILFSDGYYWQIIDIAQTPSGSLLWEVPAWVDSDQCFIIATPSIPDETFVIRESGTFTIKPDNGGGGLPGKWETLGGNFDRSGAGNFAGPELGCVKWNFETAGAVSASITIGSDDQVYIPCEDANLYAVDPNGDPLWTFKADSPLLSSATIGPDGSIYVGSSSGRLYAIDEDGYSRWTYDTAGPIYSSPAVSANGTTIFVGSGNGKLYALAEDGTMLWTHQTAAGAIGGDGDVTASPSIGLDGTVYVGGVYDPNLYAINPNGTVKWNCPFASGGWPAASPVVGTNGNIYQTLMYDSNLYAIDSEGTIEWAVNLSDPCSGWFEPYSWDGGSGTNWAYHLSDSGFSEPAIGPDGTIYAGLSDPYLRAVDPNGTIKWVTRLGMMGGFTLTIGTDGFIYAASDDGYLSVVDPNGKELSRFKSNEWLGNPVIANDGTIILADMQDKSMLKTATANAVWAINSQPCAGNELRRPYDLQEETGMDLKDYALLAQNWLDCTDNKVGSPCFPLPDDTYLTGDIDRNFYVDTEDLIAIAENWLSQD